MKKKKEFFRIRKDRKRKNGALTRARVYVYVHKPTRRRHQKTAEKGAVTLFKPYKAATSHFMGAIDRFIVRHIFVSYRRVYGRGRERG